MRVKRPDLATLVFGLTILLLLGALTWVNYGYLSNNAWRDYFTPRWLGTRLLITEGTSPYSQEATERIQEHIYGQPAGKGEDQQLFLYPLYSVGLFAPFALVEEDLLARSLWTSFQGAALVVIAVASLALTGWRPSLPILALFLLFSALWYHGARATLTGNPAVVAALFITLGLLAIRNGLDGLAGVLLSLASIKPQMVVLLLPLVLWWALTTRRWSLIFGVVGGTSALFFGAYALQPDWLIQNLRQVVAYLQYVPPGTPGGIFELWWPEIGGLVGWALSILMGALVLREWWAVRGKGFRWFLWTAAFTLLATNLIGVRTATENYVALFPAIALVFATWQQRLGFVGTVLVTASALLLSAGLWGLFFLGSTPGQPPVEQLGMYLPLPIYLLITLYWVRWWATQRRRLPMEEMRALSRI